MAFSITDTLRGIRERGLENIFQRFYSLYQVQVKDCADEQARGRAKILADSLGYLEEFPSFVETFSPFASDDAGLFLPPYPDDQVYVSFDHGDVSSPMVMGSYWKTRGEFKPKDSGLPAEFIKTEKDDNGDPVGIAPTVRGLKVKAGSALIFDETTDEVRVEMWTGQSQGIGKRAIKNHRVRLDSTKDAGQVVIATFGDENANAQTVSDDDTPTVRDKKELEGRLRHQILMRDTTDDRFVQIKTIGTDDDKKFHQILLSDKKENDEKKIRIKSAEEHFFEIDDEAESSTWSVKNSFLWLLDQKNKLMKGETPDGRRLTFDDQNQAMTMESPDGQTFKFDTSETLLEDTQHDINVKGSQAVNVDAVSDSIHVYKAKLTLNVDDDWTANLKAALKLLVTGKVVIDSAQVEIGQGNLQKLMNKIAMDAFNTHSHNYLLPLHPIGNAVTTPPLVPLIEGTHTTTATTAG